MEFGGGGGGGQSWGRFFELGCEGGREGGHGWIARGRGVAHMNSFAEWTSRFGSTTIAEMHG